MAVSNDIRLWLYPGASPNSTADAWEPYYVDISQYIRRPGDSGGRPIEYWFGKQDESTQTDAGQMTLTLDDRDGRFSTDKIDGPYYGLLDTNTPIRLGVVALSDTFTRTVSNGWGTANSTLSQSWTVTGTASNWSTNGSRGNIIIPAANTAVGGTLSNADARDVDVVGTVTPLATATGSEYGMGIFVRKTDFSNYVFCVLRFETAGSCTLEIHSVVAAAHTVTSYPIPSSSYTANNAWKVRIQADGSAIRAKAWPVSGSEPTSWQAQRTDRNNTGTAIGIYAYRAAGNTNSGVANLLGFDDMTAIGLEFTGYVVSWPNLWDITGSNCWAPITASGILRRLRQGTNPIQSPLRRQLAGTATVTGYWPMEDGSTSQYFTGTVVGTNPANFTGVTPAQDSTLAGGGVAPEITATNGTITASVKTSQGGTGMATMFMVKLPSLPGSKTRIARVRCSRGPTAYYDLSIDGTSTYLEAFAADGTSLASATNAFGAVADFTQWMAWQIETDNTLSPGNTSISAIYHQVGQVLYYSQTILVSGTTLTNVSSTQLTGPVGTNFGHLWMGSNSLPFVTDTFSLVSSGYYGESASDRFARVCGEAGIPYTITGLSTLDSEAMGIQGQSGTMSVLQACADADYGVISERGAGLEFTPRAARWNLTQTMAITVAAGQVSKVPSPIRDDQRLRNKWTISRSNGGSGTYQDDASVARNGTWEDSATINVFDDSVLVNHAAWRVNVGIQQRSRWPVIGLSFARSPELMNTWRKRFYGWRLGVTTGLSQVKGNEPDLVVEGGHASLTPEVWEVDLNCTDGHIWNAAVADDTGIYGRVDMDTGKCTTTALISSTALSIPITTAAGYTKWDNTAGLWSGGVDFNVGGERVTVTSITNGAGQAQTLNVTVRGVNGYAASHASGTVVSLWFPAPAAL